MTTQVDDILDAQVPLHAALSPLVVKALSYARMSNTDKASGDHSGHWERQFTFTVENIGYLLEAALNQSSTFEVFNARQHDVENFLGDAADDPDVWAKTYRIMRDVATMWRGQ